MGSVLKKRKNKNPKRYVQKYRELIKHSLTAKDEVVAEKEDNESIPVVNIEGR